MVMYATRFLAAVTAVAWALGGCTPTDPGSRDGDARLALNVQALTFAEVADVAYHVSVESALGPVWEASLRASRYGDGQSFSYVGPCDGDPAAQPHTVSIRVDALYGAGDVLMPDDTWANPTSPAPVSVTATCVPGTDMPVDIDLTLMRRASQGFFDIAVSFDDIFCSAKLDCVDPDDGGPILLVHGPDGVRVPTVVMALSCVDPTSSDLRLYLTDVAVDCGAGPIALDLSGGPGTLFGTTDPAPAPLHQAMRFSGQQPYTNGSTGQSAVGAYLTAAIAIDTDAVDGTCTLAAAATAHDGPLDDFALPDHATYPVIVWDLPLTAPGVEGYSCGHDALDAPGSGVTTSYAAGATTAPFAVVGYSNSPTTFVVERRTGCTPSCVGRACGDDGCGGSCGTCPGGVCDGGECSVGCDVEICGTGELAGTDGVCAPLAPGPEITITGAVVLDAAILTPGRTEPEQVYFRATRISGATVTLEAAPVGLAVGDEVLVINLMGTPAGVEHVGTNEVGVVALIDGPRVILTRALRKVYATAGNSDLSAEVVRLVRVPVYDSVALASGATLTATAFNVNGGSGVVAIDVAGTLSFADGTSTISARQLGYAGGGGGVSATNPATTSNTGYPGTGLAGPASARGQASNFGGGGGGRGYWCGNYPGDCGAGGGGGADYVKGSNGTSSTYGGRGGAPYADLYDPKYYFGAGGGGGGADPKGGGESSGSGRNGTSGARGGGIVYLRAGALSGAGLIRADGQDKTTSITSGPHEEGGGGAGAGGTVVLVGDFPALPSVDVTGGTVSNCDYCGGKGGAGRLIAEEGVRVSPPGVTGGLVSGNPGRWTDGTLAASCAAYAAPPDGAYCAATEDGVYLVDPDGGTTLNAFEVVCDFAAGTETLVCPEGYSGDPCMPVCGTLCDNGGACSAPDTCTCTASWTGPTCEEPVCAPACANGGTCVAPDTCDCELTGYTGDTCEILDVVCPTTADCPIGQYLDADDECVDFPAAQDVVVSASASLTAFTSPGRTEPDQVYYAVQSIDGATVTLSTVPAGIAIEDEVLIINLMGTPADHGQVGVYELGVVDDVTGTTVTLVRPLSGLYAAGGNADLTSQVVRLVRVPHYGSLTVNAGVTLSTTGFATGGGSGILAVSVDDTLTIGAGGQLSVGNAGYSGGGGGVVASSPSNSTNYGLAGTGVAGPDSSRGTAQNYGGGGGGKSSGTSSSGDVGGGGAGGGHVNNGNNGSTSNGGAGGVAYAAPADGRWFLGGGGGGGGADPSAYGSDSRNGYGGQPGGGILFVRARVIDNSGTLRASGHNTYGPGTSNAEEGGGGAGAGGTLIIIGGETGYGAATVAGGVVASCPGYCGGAGSVGRLLEPSRVVVEGGLVTGDPGVWSDGSIPQLCAEYLLCGAAGPGVYLVDATGGDPVDAAETTCE